MTTEGEQKTKKARPNQQAFRDSMNKLYADHEKEVIESVVKLFKYPTNLGVEWTVDEVQAYYELKLSSLVRTTEKYKKALEFYADEDKYLSDDWEVNPVIINDYGHISREALK